MSFDFQKIFDGKDAHRRKLADLPIGEKLTLLDAMRARAIAIRNATPASGSSVLREDPAPYLPDTDKIMPVKPLDDPDFIGAEAALKRASAKAIAKARAAGLEPVVSNPEDLPKQS
ncbi:hypothetical protein [Haloferula sp.]|uniref:hypothetical protein n=1 Tax=Haloferula sp. TaxID=2497595 RepID=UPI003C74B1C2